MRKLKLQVHMTVDGFVCGPDGQLDWMTWRWNENDKLAAFVHTLTNASDTILLGRNMTSGFIAHWEKVASEPNSPMFAIGSKMVGIPKIVFSRTLADVKGKNVRVENGPLADAVKRLKATPGKDIIVYGGASFVSSLITEQLVDEFNLFINPVAIGQGLRIFNSRTALKFVSSNTYECGVVVNTYVAG